MSTIAADALESPWGRWLGIGWRRLIHAFFAIAPVFAGRGPTDQAIDRIPASDPDRDLLIGVLQEYPHGTRRFTELVELHWGRVWMISQSVLMNEHDAEEVAQDTFLKVHRNLLGFRFESRFSTWLNRIARNTALTKLASRRRDRSAKERVTEDPTLSVWWLPRKSPDPAGGRSDMGRALDALPVDDRLLLGLRELEGRDYDEIAEALEIAAGAARMRVSRARERLRRSLLAIRGKGGGS